MSADKIISEARARVFWGEPSSAVRDFLVANGVSADVAEARIKEFESERRQELRRMGFRNVLIGGTLAAAASVALCLALPVASASSGYVSLLAVVLLAGVFGFWKLVKGVVYLVRPQSEHGSIPDIAQSDLIE